MKSKQLLFFLIFQDWEEILNEIEATANIQYYLTGLLDSKEVPKYKSMLTYPELGLASDGDWNRVDSFLVLKKSTRLMVRDVQQKAGGTKYAVDQLINPQSIEFKPSGIYKETDNVIVAGRVATVSQQNDSNELYKLFTEKIKKKCKRIGAFYVGKHAEKKLKEGWRLVTMVESSKEYDLSID